MDQTAGDQAIQMLWNTETVVVRLLKEGGHCGTDLFT